MALAAGGPKDTNNNSKVVYAVTNGYGPLSGMAGGEVWVTTNAGVRLMTNVTQNVNPQRLCDFVGRDGFVGCDRQHGVYRNHGIQHAGISNVTCMEDGECWHELDGLERNRALPDAPVNALLVDSQAGAIYAGTDVGVFVSSTTTAELDGSWSCAGAGGVWVFAECSGNGAATFQS